MKWELRAFDKKVARIWPEILDVGFEMPLAQVHIIRTPTLATPSFAMTFEIHGVGDKAGLLLVSGGTADPLRASSRSSSNCIAIAWMLRLHVIGC